MPKKGLLHYDMDKETWHKPQKPTMDALTYKPLTQAWNLWFNKSISLIRKTIFLSFDKYITSGLKYNCEDRH